VYQPSVIMVELWFKVVPEHGVHHFDRYRVGATVSKYTTGQRSVKYRFLLKDIVVQSTRVRDRAVLWQASPSPA